MDSSRNPAPPTTRNPSILRRLLPYAFLLASVLVFYRHVLFYGGYVIPWDFRYDHFPVATFVADSFQRGELPLWDPYTYCGRPLYANMQAQVFYPPTVVAVLLANATQADDLLYFLEWQLALHVFLGGVFGFLLLRRLALRTPAALLGAVVYELGGYFASQAQHLGAVDGAAWLPLAWMSVLVLGERFNWRWVAALAGSLAMTVLAGLPAMASVAFLSCGVLAMVLMAFRLARVQALLGLALASLGAVLLAAVQLLPTVELTWHSVARYRDEWLGTGGGLPLLSVASLVMPNYAGVFDLTTYSHSYDPTFLYVFCGFIGLGLALAAPFLSRRKEVLVFGVLSLFFGLWMLGDNTPFGVALLFILPSFLEIGMHPHFALAAFNLSLAVLAALGADSLLRRPLLSYGVAAAVAAELILVSSGRPMNAFPVAQEPGVHRDHFDGSEELLRGVRELVNQSTPPARIDTVKDSLSWAMTAPVTLVPTANGNDPFAPARLIEVRLAFCRGERWGRYFEVDDPSSPVLDLVNVRYILSFAALDEALIDESKFHQVTTLPAHHVYENREALPRFFLVNRVRRALGLEEAASLLRSSAFKPREEAIVEAPPAFENIGGRAMGTVSVLSYAPSAVMLEVDTPTAAFLVTSENHYPGWRAYLDQQPVSLYYTNVAFRGLPVPAGKHMVEMRFEPPLLSVSMGISAIAWVLWVVGAVGFSPVRRRRR